MKYHKNVDIYFSKMSTYTQTAGIQLGSQLLFFSFCTALKISKKKKKGAIN